MNLEHWGSTATEIDGVVNLSPERREGKRCVVLADVAVELACLNRRSREQPLERFGWGRGRRQLNLPIAAAHAEQRVQGRASGLLDAFVEPVEHSALRAGPIHTPEVVPADGFDVRPSSGRDPVVSLLDP